MPNPAFSLVTTTRNCEDALVVTAKSIRAQTFRDFEWIVQDCTSSDRTLSVAQRLFPEVQIHSSPDDGIYDAMNKAVTKCNGTWVLFIQAGDWLAGKDALKAIFSRLLDSTEIGLAPVYEISINGMIMLRKPSSPLQKLARLTSGGLADMENHFLENMPCHQGIFMRRDVFENLKFDLSYVVSADWHHLFKAASAGCLEQTLHTPIAWYPNGGFSFEHSDLWIQDVIRICKEYSDANLVDSHFKGALEHHVAFQAERRECLRDAAGFIQSLA